MEVFVWFLLFADYTVRADDSTIGVDPEHLKQYTYCGKLFEHEWHDARSRAVNSRESEIQYPWVVYVKRFYRVEFTDGSGQTGGMTHASCSGTITGNK